MPTSASIHATGNVTVSALSSNKTDANVLAVSIGAIGVGFSNATSTSRNTTRARLLGPVTSGASVTVLARGNEGADAVAIAASGGIAAGASAEAHADVIQNVAGRPDPRGVDRLARRARHR